MTPAAAAQLARLVSAARFPSNTPMHRTPVPSAAARRDRYPATAARSPSPALRRLAPPLLIVAATLAAYSPVRHHGFVWDDAVYIRDNAHIRSLSWENLRWMLFSAQGGDYQPLTYLSWALDHALSGGAAWSFHLTNVLLHAAAALLFYFIARRLLCAAGAASQGPPRPGAIDLAALLAALLFALHPLRVEAVAWASNRAYVLPGFLAMLTVHAWLRAVTPAAALPQRAPAWRRAAVCLFAASLLATPVALMLPVLLLLLDVYPLRRLHLGRAPALRDPVAPPNPAAALSPSRALLEKLPFILLALAAGIIAVWGKSRAGAVADLAELPLAQRVLLALYTPAFLLGKTLWPLDLNPLIAVPIPFTPWTLRYLVPAAITVSLMVVLLLAARRVRALAAAWFAYLILLFPFSGIVHHGTQLTAERYTYLATLPITLLAGAILVLPARRRAVPAASLTLASCIVVGLAALSWRQVAVWRDEEALWTHAIRLDSRCYVCYYNRGVTRSLPADPAAEPQLEHAAEDFRRALEIHPAYVDAANNLGNVYQALGRPDDAESQYRTALRFRPDFADALNNLGVVLLSRDRLDDAEHHFRQALDADPDHPLALAGLADCFARRDRLDEALESYRRAARADPRYAYPRRCAANLLYEAGRVAEAADAFDDLLRVDPRDAVARNTFAIALIRQGRFSAAIRTLRDGLDLDPHSVPLAANLVRLLATCPDRTLRDPTAAVALGERIAAGADDAQFLASLAVAYLAAGRRDDSQSAAQRAVAAALRAGQPDLAQRILDELNRLAAEP